jgi:hypothetical protein
MKHTCIALFFLGLAALSALHCKKDDDLGRGVDLVYRRNLEIPAGLGVFDVHHFYINNIPTNYTGTLDLAGVNPADVTKILTTQGTLTGTFGDANLDFIDRVSLRVFKDDPNNYLEIGYRDPAPVDPGNTMGLIPSLADSKGFFSEDRVSLDVVIWLRRTTNESTPLQLDLTLRAAY